MMVEDLVAMLGQLPVTEPVCWLVCHEGHPLQSFPPGESGPHLLIFGSQVGAEVFVAGRRQSFGAEPLSVVAVDSAAALKALVASPARDSRYTPPPCGLLLNFAYPSGAVDRRLTPQQCADMDAGQLAQALGPAAAVPAAAPVLLPPSGARPAANNLPKVLLGCLGLVLLCACLSGTGTATYFAYTYLRNSRETGGPTVFLSRLTVTPTERPSPTVAPTEPPTIAPTKTPTATLTPTSVPTHTPSPTPTATATATRRPTRIPVVPTDTPTLTPSPVWATGVGGGRHGVTGQLTLGAHTDTYTAGSRVLYTMALNNTTGAPVNYGVLGVAAVALEDGSNVFGTAWSAAVTPNGFIQLPAGPFTWSTYIIPKVPGRYAVHVSMCFSRFSDCLSGGDWENLSPDLLITVR